MKIKDCMCEKVISVRPEAKVQDVAKLMSENKIGCVPVCDNENKICGIVTDRDLVLRCIACEKDSKNTKISEIMSCNVCTCNENEEIINAETLMGKNQIRRLPVCNKENQVVGIFSIGDLVQNDKEIGKEQMCYTIENICDCNKNKNAQ